MFFTGHLLRTSDCPACLFAATQDFRCFCAREPWPHITSIKLINCLWPKKKKSSSCFLSLLSWGSFWQILWQLCGCHDTDHTHRKSNVWVEKWDLVFNCCVCCCWFPGLIYSLAALWQLLKHIIYSDVFVSCRETKHSCNYALCKKSEMPVTEQH